MEELVILVVEDEPEVRVQVVRDLSGFGPRIRIDEAADVDDALAALEESERAGDVVGLAVVDHRLPGRSGVDLLSELHADPARRPIRSILLTGQAGHADTIRAINEAGLDHYLAKPWDPEELVAVARRLLTDRVVERGHGLLDHVAELDGPRLLEAYAREGRAD